MGLMEELNDVVQSRIKEERHRIFRWMSRSLNLSTRFMVPDEDGRGDLGNDGSVATGYEALRRLVDEPLTAKQK